MDSVVGFIVELDSNQNIKQTGYGIRYRVRRLGIDSPATPANKLPWFDVLLPPTEGSGDGLKARSVNYSVGDMVVVEHMDSSKQHGWIKGHFARTSLIQYSGDVKTADQTTASGGDQGGEITLPTKVNKGRGKPGESKTADSEEEKDAIEAVKKGTGATDSTKKEDPNAKSDATATAPPITVNTLPPGWRVVEGGFVEQNDGRIVGEVNEDGTINTG